MPRRPNIDPPVSLLLKLPESLRARLDLLLFSELEGRVPKGKYQEFFIERMREYFENRPLALEAYGIAGTVSGPKETVEELERKLKHGHS
jgi:hypothetical protein